MNVFGYLLRLIEGEHKGCGGSAGWENDPAEPERRTSGISYRDCIFKCYSDCAGTEAVEHGRVSQKQLECHEEDTVYDNPADHSSQPLGGQEFSF